MLVFWVGAQVRSDSSGTKHSPSYFAQMQPVICHKHSYKDNSTTSTCAETEASTCVQACHSKHSGSPLQPLSQDRATVNGPAESHLRLPNTLSISIGGFSASTALHQLRDALAVSAGSACHSASSISHVLKAMQVGASWSERTPCQTCVIVNCLLLVRHDLQCIDVTIFCKCCVSCLALDGPDKGDLSWFLPPVLQVFK